MDLTEPVTIPAGLGPAQVPRILVLLALVGAVIAANRYAPGTLQVVVGLVVLYVLLTHVAPAAGLIHAVPAGLARAFPPSPAGGAGNRVR